MLYYDFGDWPIAPKFRMTSVTTAYTIDSSYPDFFILCDATGGAFNVTLPAATNKDGRIYHIKKTDVSANAITIIGTIEGAVNPTLAAQYNSMTIYSDGTNWFTITTT